MTLDVLGFSIGRTNTLTSKNALKSALEERDIKLILDVGANTGQFHDYVRSLGWFGDIVSYEPLPSAYAALEKKYDEVRGNWEIHNCAIGRMDGKLSLNVAKNSVSSSFLDVEQVSIDAAPGSGFTGKVEVPVITLVSAFDGRNAFLKVDVQGFEGEVLQGITKWDDIRLVQLELSLIPIYKGAWSFSQLVLFMEAMGFELFDLNECFRAKNSRLLQVDALFVRKKE